ncbi:hypothetical protein ACFSQ7_01845 [Paenibacillus rhizoplanae]
MLDERYAQWEVWSEGPSNRKLDPKAQFLQACQQTGQQFLQAEGFKSNKAGTVWKKTAADKDTVFELSFNPQSYNTRTDVRMTVNLRIASKSLKNGLPDKPAEGTIPFCSARCAGRRNRQAPSSGRSPDHSWIPPGRRSVS